MISFDFDGTLTERDTFLLFSIYVAYQRRLWSGIFLVIIFSILHKLRFISHINFKSGCIRSVYSGLSDLELERLAKKYAPYVPLRSSVCLLENEEFFVVTASPCLVVETWMSEYHKCRVVGTTFDYNAGNISGVDEICYGLQKVNMFIREHNCLELYVGDSKSDLAMLACSKEVVLVKNSRELKTVIRDALFHH